VNPGELPTSPEAAPSPELGTWIQAVVVQWYSMIWTGWFPGVFLEGIERARQLTPFVRSGSPPEITNRFNANCRQNGEDLRHLPRDDRKSKLAKLLRASRHSGIVLNEHLEADGERAFWHACNLGFEGIDSKRRAVDTCPAAVRFG
jgi:hypothetical protein